MDLRIKLFGPEARALGASEAPVRAPEGVRCEDLRDLLGKAHPALAGSLAHARIAVNGAFASDDRAIEPGDEVALIGLVSGG